MGTASRLEKKEEITRLLAQGLDYYGDDAIGKAIQTWRQVLELDPGNPEAIDYIQTADRRDQRRLPPEEQMSDTHRRLVHEACGRIESDDWEGALDLLRSTSEGGCPVLEYEATIEIVRGQLSRQYRDRVGEQGGVPSLRNAAGDITSYNLPSDAGFMLSLIDGTTAIADLISLSGMDAFEALRILGGLLDADIVEMHA
jgi:hypothetical protein